MWLYFLDWRPQGMFERIASQYPIDTFSQPSNTSNISNININMNVNTRQREIKKPEPPPSVEEFIKRGKI